MSISSSNAAWIHFVKINAGNQSAPELSKLWNTLTLKQRKLYENPDFNLSMISKSSAKITNVNQQENYNLKQNRNQKEEEEDDDNQEQEQEENDADDLEEDEDNDDEEEFGTNEAEEDPDESRLNLQLDKALENLQNNNEFEFINKATLNKGSDDIQFEVQGNLTSSEPLLKAFKSTDNITITANSKNGKERLGFSLPRSSNIKLISPEQLSDPDWRLLFDSLMGLNQFYNS